MEERLRDMQNLYKSGTPETYSSGDAAARYEKAEPSELRQLLRSTEDDAAANGKSATASIRRFRSLCPTYSVQNPAN